MCWVPLNRKHGCSSLNCLHPAAQAKYVAEAPRRSKKPGLAVEQAVDRSGIITMPMKPACILLIDSVMLCG